MIQVLHLFMTMLFLAGFAINGFYNITRGQWQTKPDGTKVWVGKIFKFWSKFFQQHTVVNEFYKGQEWLKQFNRIKDFFLDHGVEIREIMESGVAIKKMDDLTSSLFNAFAAANGILFTNRNFDNGSALISIYKEVKKDKIPNWISAPLSECITCLSSFWGTVCWIIFYQVGVSVQKVYPTETAQAFLGLPLTLKIVLWIVFCTSLAWINEIVFNINNNLKTEK